MRSAPIRPCAIAIGGLDPGGGAGILADMRAFAAAGVFGCAAIAVETVQSTSGLVRARPIAPRDVIGQAREVLAHQNVRAIKTGALGSAANVRAVARLAEEHSHLPLVVDPVMIASRSRGARSGGARLLDPRGIDAMTRALFPRAWLVTANADEAALFTSLDVKSTDDAEIAARAICAMGAGAALIKGGHLRDRDAVDVLVVRDGITDRRVTYRARRIPSLLAHGTGCTLASLIAGRLALSPSIHDRDRARAIIAAVRWAKRIHHRALVRASNVGGALRVLEF